MSASFWVSPTRAPVLFRHAFAPDNVGRRILCGFSFWQRIGKAATTSFWAPPESPLAQIKNMGPLARELLATMAPDWAAVRHYEILRDAGNLAIYDMEVDELNRSFTYLMKMRGGGYRLSVITLGDYTRQAGQDAQKTLDTRLRETIAQMINMLYLNEPSRLFTARQTQAIEANRWTLDGALPHVALTLGAADLFRKKKEPLRRALENRFFDLLASLPRAHLSSDVAVGLTLPELNDQRHWTYIPRKEEQYFLFQKALTDVFESANWLSLDGLQTGLDKGRDEMAIVRHLQGHGFRLTPEAHRAQCNMAQFATASYKMAA